MVTGCQLALCLSQVERATVGLGVTSYEEYEESQDGRHVALDDEPAPRTDLSLNDAAHLHGACEDYGRDKAEAERHLIGNHLHGATHGRHYRILVVGTPSGEEHAEYAYRADGGDEEQAHIEVEDMRTHVPWQE